MMKVNSYQCEDCHDPTKRPTGCWDGIDGEGRRISGFIFNCSNTKCLVKQEMIKAGEEAKQQKKAVQKENQRNDVDIQEMVRARKQAELTMRDCAQALGVSLSKYSDYECERKPMPPQEWQRIMDIAKEGRDEAGLYHTSIQG